MSPIQIPDLGLFTLTPELIVGTTAVVILLISMLIKPVESINLTLTSLTGLVVAYIAAGYLKGVSEAGFGGMILRDDLSVFFDRLFVLGAVLVILIGHRYAERRQIPYGEYLVLILFSTLGMMVIGAGEDLIILFLGIELISLCLYVLAGLDKNSLLSGEAALKYLLLGAFSSAFFVYGIALIYGMCRTTNLLVIGSTFGSGVVSSPILVLGIALVLVGLGFKISLVPFHQWAPDVYQGAPTPITAWIAGGSKIAGFAALIRIFSLTGTSLAPMSGLWVEGVRWLCLLTMIIGNAGALVQNDIKRMLAYSSIAHGGYLSMAFVSHSEVGLQALLFYLVVYLLTTVGAFGVVASLGRKDMEYTRISQFAGLAQRRPWLSGMMTVFLLSLAGMPLTGGFIGKVWLFGSAVGAQYYDLAIVGILTTLLSFYYYLRVIVYMYMKEEEEAFPQERASFSNTIALGFAAIVIVVLGIFPNLLWSVVSAGIRGY